MSTNTFLIISVLASLSVGIVAGFVMKRTVYFVAPLVAPRAFGSRGAGGRTGLVEFFDNFFKKYFTNSVRLEHILKSGLVGSGWSIENVMRLKEYSVAAAVIIFIFYFYRGVGGIELIILATALFLFAIVWPVMYLKRAVLFKKRALEREFPSIIDYLRLYVGAGMGLVQAFRTIGDRLTGIWADEWKKMVAEMDHGIPFVSALERMDARLNIDSLRRFIGAIKQGEQLGASLHDTLAIQSDSIRTRRRQAAEEQARTAGVKIALPLVLCIFPALLIVYLAPAILRLMVELGGA